jgi:hypothetical protein
VNSWMNCDQSTLKHVAQTRFAMVFLFVLVRVISWIVLFTPPKRMIHEITRTNTKRSQRVDFLGAPPGAEAQ